MAKSHVKRMVLDILKPHIPNALEFAQRLAQVGEDYHVSLTVLEIDEATQTIQIDVTGNSIHFEALQLAINEMGGSLHSIDVVEVSSQPTQNTQDQS
ncbi:MAG: DUF211 domain-containing protein [Gammaproteobacteria bacterium]|nr:DUF211 domain-containing protein [Gammaproteobacteria bacterium]